MPKLPYCGLQTTCIIDGGALIYALNPADLGITIFGQLAVEMWKLVCQALKSGATRVDVIFDQYREDFVKMMERKRREHASPLIIHIIGSATAIPKQWDRYINLSKIR